MKESAGLFNLQANIPHDCHLAYCILILYLQSFLIIFVRNDLIWFPTSTGIMRSL